MSTNGLSTATVGTVWRMLSGSLALMTGRVSATELEHGIRDKYSERLELDTARQQASLGLTESECDLFRRHLAAGSRILDIGCAGGRVNLALSRDGFRVIGGDFMGA